MSSEAGGASRLSRASSDSSDAGAARTLWMGDLAYWMDEGFLFEIFSSTGEVSGTKVIRNKATGLSEGYGFIEFSSHEAAGRALQFYNGKVMIPQTEQLFRLNWAAFGVGRGGSEDHSVFVGDLAPEVTDFMLQDQFRKMYPSVRSAKVITDLITGRHKGYGFVRFSNEGERDRALVEMSGHDICGRPIRVSVATAKRSPPLADASSGDSNASTGSGTSTVASEVEQTNTTLFIGGLSDDVTEPDLHRIFSRHGEVVYTKIPQGKGCGFVQFVHRHSAVAAKQAFHGQQIGKAAVRISWGRQQANRYPQAIQMGQAYSYMPGFYGGYYDPSAAYYDPVMYASYYRVTMDQMYQGYQPGAFMSMAPYQISAYHQPSKQGDGNSSTEHQSQLPGSASDPAKAFKPLGSRDIQRMQNMYVQKVDSHHVSGSLEVS